MVRVSQHTLLACNVMPAAHTAGERGGGGRERGGKVEKERDSRRMGERRIKEHETIFEVT